MNIDERLEKFVERREALTQTIETVAGMQRASAERHAALVQTVELLAGMQRASEERLAKNEELAARMMDAINKLVRVAEIHERRLQPPLARQLQKMKEDWDRRAQENARHYVATDKREWTDEEFFASGRVEVEEAILSDMTNVCQSRPPKEMRVLEIGCGAGRVTRALAEIFGEVHAVDVSGEMVERARQSLADLANVRLYRNNGMDLSVLPDLPFDFAFSTVVFQHIANPEIIENYICEVHRLLRPAGLFKFQVNGCATGQPRIDCGDTWVGAEISRDLAMGMAERCGFELRYDFGRETQQYWLWFFNGTQAL